MSHRHCNFTCTAIINDAEMKDVLVRAYHASGSALFIYGMYTNLITLTTLSSAQAADGCKVKGSREKHR